TDEGATPQVRIHYRDITPNFWIVTDAAQSRYNIESPRDNPGHFPENLLALSAITALMRIAQTDEMPWGLIASDDQGIAFRHRSPRLGRIHSLRTANHLAELTNGEADEHADFRLAELFKYLGRNCSNNVIAIVSDFRDEQVSHNAAKKFS